MLKSIAEEFLYWIISALINLVLLSFLSTVFIVKVREVPEIYPLRVEIKEIVVKKPKKKRSIVKARSVAKKTVGRTIKGSAKKRKAGATVSKAHKKGDVKVPVQEEEDVSVLAELQKKIESRLKKKKKESKKEVGVLSAVLTKGEVKIKGGTRDIVYTPPVPELIASEFPGAVRVRIWVSPDGRVIKAILLQRSGNVNIDSTLLSYVRGIRFEKVRDEEVQVGEITFRFQGG